MSFGHITGMRSICWVLLFSLVVIVGGGGLGFKYLTRFVLLTRFILLASSLSVEGCKGI